MTAKRKMRKITVVLPEDILLSALESSEQGIAATVRQGLELLSAKTAYERLRKLRGKVPISIDLAQLRED